MSMLHTGLNSTEKYKVEQIDPGASSLQPFPNGEYGIPGNWNNDRHRSPTHRPYILEELSKKCWEYTCIESEFKKAGAQVCTVHRIENKELWEKFNSESQRMLRLRTGVNEVYLLHGSKGNKEDISHEGLDQRLSRIGHFGRGIYFSNDVRKCFSYTKKDDSGKDQPTERKCTVYKCRVLLGIVKVYPKGQNAKHLKREPKLDKPGPGGLKYYDSVKGQVSDYEEYIVYKSERSLPEYIITCIPPGEEPSSNNASQSGPVAATNGLPDTATNGQADVATDGKASPADLTDGIDDEKSLELRYTEDERERSDSVTSAGDDDDNISGAMGGSRGERSGSVGGDDLQEEEVCESAGEDDDADEDVCESAEEDVYESAGESANEDLYSPEVLTSTANPFKAAATAAASAVADSPTPDSANTNSSSESTSTADTAENEFERHLLEVRKRVQERRRRESLNPPPPSCTVQPPAPYVAPAATGLDDDHQRRLEEVRKKVREKRLKEKQKTSHDNSSASTTTTDESEEVVIVNQVMSSLLAQFLEFTGCDDTEVASRYIRHAQMDVNNAIVMYLNTEQ